jgi:hypothetical protein
MQLWNSYQFTFLTDSLEGATLIPLLDSCGTELEN